MNWWIISGLENLLQVNHGNVNLLTDHDLCFRKAHYERRGAVKNRIIDIYQYELYYAISHYDHIKFINMDETFGKNRNIPSKYKKLKEFPSKPILVLTR